MKLTARIALGTTAVLAAAGLGAGVATYAHDAGTPVSGSTAPHTTEPPAPAPTTTGPTAPASQTPTAIPDWTPTPHVPPTPARRVDPATAAPDGGPWKDPNASDPTPAPGPTDNLPCQGSREVCYP